MDFNKEGVGAFFTTLLWMKYFAFRRWSLNLALTLVTIGLKHFKSCHIGCDGGKIQSQRFSNPIYPQCLPLESHIIELHRCKRETEVSEVNYFMDIFYCWIDLTYIHVHTIDTEVSSSLLLFFILSMHFSGDVLR